MIDPEVIRDIEEKQQKREFIYRNKKKIIDIFGKDTYEKMMIQEGREIKDLFDGVLSK